MLAIKRSYVEVVQGLAGSGLFSALERRGRDAAPYGWRRWAASLLAIYDSERMVGLDLPWWNVAATREVEFYLKARPGARVFEYGSGASTAWLAKRAAQVISVEHDGAWLNKFGHVLRPLGNVELLHRPMDADPRNYIDAITGHGTFDLIVVDGRRRADCLAAAQACLNPGGIILFDDSGRKRYRAAIENCGFAERHHYGRSYCVPYPDHTSILRPRG